MGLLNFLKNRFSSSYTPSIMDWYAGTDSGVTVTKDVALRTTAFLCAARVISEGVAQCPLKLYTEIDNGGRKVREPARDHELYDLLAYSPSWLTSSEWLELTTLWAFVEGNGYGVKNRGATESGRVLEIIPVSPNDMTVLAGDDGAPEYYLTGESTPLPREDVIHLRGPSWNSSVGESVRSLAKEAIGLSVQMEASHGTLYSKGATPAGILSTDAEMTEEKKKSAITAWQQRYSSGGKGGVALLDGGFKFHQITMSAVDAQFLENRKFQIEEIARATRVFPQMLMHSDKTSTFASASEFFQAHVKHSLHPWINRWEGVIKRDLIGYSDKSIWPRFSMEGLLRGSPKERAEFYQMMVQIGVMSPNEVREKENLNPREGGDEYLTPMNFRIGDNEEQGGEKSNKKFVNLSEIRDAG